MHTRSCHRRFYNNNPNGPLPMTGRNFKPRWKLSNTPSIDDEMAVAPSLNLHQWSTKKNYAQSEKWTCPSSHVPSCYHLLASSARRGSRLLTSKEEQGLYLLLAPEGWKPFPPTPTPGGPQRGIVKVFPLWSVDALRGGRWILTYLYPLTVLAVLPGKAHHKSETLVHLGKTLTECLPSFKNELSVELVFGGWEERIQGRVGKEWASKEKR